jgi:hypothetical protein
MMRALVAAFAFMLVTVLPAQAQDPQITVTTDQDEVIVGQAFIVRVKVLVPTFMPRAPVFPSFEVPGLIVRLPERSTGPVSERIGGETWSGVQRSYRIYPTRAGVSDIPAQQVEIVYKDPDTNADVTARFDVPATQIIATVPDGARDLDPLILAQGLTIAQDWQGGEGALAVGDAVVRSVDIKVTGASPLFVPELLTDQVVPGGDAPQDTDTADAIARFMPYPEDARITETFDRGIMSGSRHEQVSYIATAGGTVTFPDITLRWYNIDSETVEEISLPGREVSVAFPPQVRAPFDWQGAVRLALAGLGAALLIWAGRKWVWPRVRVRMDDRRAAYALTARAAHDAAQGRVQARDLNGLLAALDLRAARGVPVSAPLTAALHALTRALYSDHADAAQAKQHWQAIDSALRADRPTRNSQSAGRNARGLPPLNPQFTGLK